MICKTCRKVLNTYTDMSGVAYVHSAQDPDDHPVVPVPAPPDYAEGQCDFCSGTPPTHVLPARSFTVPFDAHQSSGADGWAACAKCADLIERNEWSRLVVRAARAVEEQHGIPAWFVAASMSELYQRLRANVTGPLRPIAPRADES